MGQFMGYQSYTRHTFCQACGEEWPSEDTDHYHICPVSDDEEFLNQSEKTIEEMGQEGCYLSQKEKEDKDES